MTDQTPPIPNAATEQPKVDVVDVRPAPVPAPEAAGPTAADTDALRPGSDEPPTLESFDFDMESWARAMSAHSRNQIQAGITSALNASRKKEAEESAQAAIAERFSKGLKELTPELQAALAIPLPTLAPEAARVIVENENGAVLAAEVARNPDEAKRIAALSPARQLLELGKIQAQLERQAKIDRETADARFASANAETAALIASETAGSWETLELQRRQNPTSQRSIDSHAPESAADWREVEQRRNHTSILEHGGGRAHAMSSDTGEDWSDFADQHHANRKARLELHRTNAACKAIPSQIAGNAGRAR